MSILPEEVRLYIPYAPADSCKTISRFITGLYLRRHFSMEISDYEREVITILERVSENYNPKLGHLVRYAKNTLSLKLKDYVSRHHVRTLPLTEDTLVDQLVEEIQEAWNWEDYSDAAIQAIFNIAEGKSSKKDRDIVNALFNTELKET